MDVVSIRGPIRARSERSGGRPVSVTEQAARASLRADGRFCVIVGTVIVLASTALAEPLGIPVWLTVLAGLASIAWGVWVFRLARSERWVTAITVVAVSNSVAGIGLAVFALMPGGARLRLFIGGLAALAALWFSVTQAIIRWNVRL